MTLIVTVDELDRIVDSMASSYFFRRERNIPFMDGRIHDKAYELILRLQCVVAKCEQIGETYIDLSADDVRSMMFMLQDRISTSSGISPLRIHVR